MQAALAAVAQLPDREHPDEQDERSEVGQLHEPVAGVRERRGGHPFAAESSQRPRHVKHTMRSSMTICERVAARWLPWTTSARSWASISAATWPTTSATTCTYQIAVADTTPESAAPKRSEPSPSGSDASRAMSWPL